jgi:hypothetical protein
VEFSLVLDLLMPEPPPETLLFTLFSGLETTLAFLFLLLLTLFEDLLPTLFFAHIAP